MSVQTVHFFRPPSLSPSSVQTNIFGFHHMGFMQHNIYCETTRINPSFKPVWYVTNDSFAKYDLQISVNIAYFQI